MAHLLPRDYELVLNLLPRLYAPTEAADFPRHSLRVLRALIPAADDVAWIGFALDRTPKLNSWIALNHGVHDKLLERMEDGIASHPFTGKFGPPTNSSRVMMLSEFPKSMRDRHRAEYADVYRALDIGDGMMAVVEVRGGEALAVTLNRKTRDFNERDRLKLALVRKHLRRAHENARLLVHNDSRAPRAASIGDQFGLTPRECDVAFWLSHGKTNAEIAIILHVACRTAEKHVEAILRKLKVENRTTAAGVLRRSNVGNPENTLSSARA
jgi:DNA-binding CsgD family transcriptional regulator